MIALPRRSFQSSGWHRSARKSQLLRKDRTDTSEMPPNKYSVAAPQLFPDMSDPMSVRQLHGGYRPTSAVGSCVPNFLITGRLLADASATFVRADHTSQHSIGASAVQAIPRAPAAGCLAVHAGPYSVVFISWLGSDKKPPERISRYRVLIDEPNEHIFWMARQKFAP